MKSSYEKGRGRGCRQGSQWKRDEMTRPLRTMRRFIINLRGETAWRRAWFELNAQIFGYFISGGDSPASQPTRPPRVVVGVLLPIRAAASLIRFVINTSAAVGPSREITFANIMAKTPKTVAEITTVGGSDWILCPAASWIMKNRFDISSRRRLRGDTKIGRAPFVKIHARNSDRIPCLFPCQHIYGWYRTVPVFRLKEQTSKLLFDQADCTWTLHANDWV